MTTDGLTLDENITAVTTEDPVAELWEASRYGKCFLIERISFKSDDRRKFRCLLGRLQFRHKKGGIQVFMEKPFMKEVTLVFPFDLQVGHVIFQNPTANGSSEIAVYENIERSLVQRLR